MLYIYNINNNNNNNLEQAHRVWRQTGQPRVGSAPAPKRKYGQFSKCHVCFCGLYSGNLNFETVRTHKQHIRF